MENANTPKPIIEFEEVDISNGELTVIESLTLTVREGEFLYITGKVGSGKTSIVRSLIGENPVSGKRAEVVGFDLLHLRKRQIPYLRREIGIVFQDFQLLMDRSVEENLRFVLEATGWRNKAAVDTRIEEVLHSVGLTNKAHKMPHQLSGGEQQRVAIARALLNRPRILLADEPTGNLDVDTTHSIMDLLWSINAKEGTAVLMVTHNRNILSEYPGKVLVCEDSVCREIFHEE